MIVLDFEDGKYTALLLGEGDNFHGIKVLRYGEPWRDFTGDNFVSLVLYEIAEERGISE